jgi:uncharacterized membrane protein
MTTRLLAIAFLTLAGAAAAQQPTHAMPMQDHPPMGCDMHGMMMGGGPMMGGHMSGQMPGQMSGQMGGMMNDSSMMARMRSELDLTDAQMQAMRDMHQRACAAAAPHMQLAMQAHQAAMQALQGDSPNLDHFEDQLDKAAKHMVEAQVEMAKQMIAFRATLTPAQRQKMDQMHQRMMPGSR